MAPFKPSKDIVYLRDNTLASGLASGLNELRKQKVLCDVNIKIGDDAYHAHKAVLSIASPYFRTMFTSGFRETNSSEVTIAGDGEAFGSLLRFAYTGNLRLSQATLADILFLVCYMQFDKAIKLCEEYVKDTCKQKSMSFDNALVVAALGEKHNLADLSMTANEYLAKNFLEFSKTDVFLETQVADSIVQCLRRTDIARLHHKNEKQILDAVVGWLKYDWQKRKQDGAKLLREVRLGLVPKEDLVSKLQVFVKIPECKKMLKAAIALKEDMGDRHPLALARQYPSLCASRTTMTTPMVASRKASYYYDKKQQCWFKMRFSGPQVEGRFWYTYNHSLIVVNDELYAAGGLYQTIESKNNSMNTASFTKYNPLTNEWLALDKMNMARSKCTLIKLNSYIYAIGGQGDASVERYNLCTGKWSKPGEVAPMQKLISHVSAVAFQGSILVYGRIEPSVGELRSGFESFHIYDPSSNTWYCQGVSVMIGFTQASRQQQVEFPILTVHNDKCYIVSYIDMGGFPAMSKPMISQLSICLPYGNTAVSICPTNQPQNLIPFNTCGAFTIDNDVFVNANGFVHNTGIQTTREQKKQVSLDEWKSIKERKEAVVCYTFDTQLLRKK